MHPKGGLLMMRAMTDEISRLLTLQDRDQRIRAFKAELAQIPAERKAREKQLADSAARLDAAKTRLREIEVEKNNLELEIGAKRSAIDRYKGQQLQTRKNEEYSALQHEIEASGRAISALEDSEIVLMEEAEKLAPQITAAEAEHAVERQRIEKAIEALAAKIPNIESRLAELETARTQACEGLDEDLLERYDRLFSSKAGAALVPLEHDVCTGCHMRVTHQAALEVRAAKSIVHCPNCGRMLHLPS